MDCKTRTRPCGDRRGSRGEHRDLTVWIPGCL